jgi:hypothetical protein
MPSSRDSFRRNRVAPVGTYRITPRRNPGQTGLFLQLRVRSLSARQGEDAVAMLGKAGEQGSAATGFVVCVVETGRHCGAEQSKCAAGKQTRALPNASGDVVLEQHASGEVVAQSDRIGCAVFAKQKSLDGIAEVEMKHFVAGKAVERRKSAGSEHVEDGGGCEAVAAVRVGQNGLREGESRPIRFDEIAAFDRMRAEMKKFDDFFWSEHDEGTIEAAREKRKAFGVAENYRRATGRGSRYNEVRNLSWFL